MFIFGVNVWCLSVLSITCCLPQPSPICFRDFPWGALIFLSLSSTKLAPFKTPLWIFILWSFPGLNVSLFVSFSLFLRHGGMYLLWGSLLASEGFSLGCEMYRFYYFSFLTVSLDLTKGQPSFVLLFMWGSNLLLFWNLSSWVGFTKPFKGPRRGRNWLYVICCLGYWMFPVGQEFLLPRATWLALEAKVGVFEVTSITHICGILFRWQPWLTQSTHNFSLL